MIAANVHALLYIFFKISSETKRTTHICQPHKCSFRRWYWELKSIVCRENMSLYSWELEGKWKMKALDLAGWPKRFFFSFRFLSVLFVQCQHWQQKYYFLRCWWWILALRTLPGGFFKSKTLFFKKKNFKILVWVRVNIRNGFRKPSGELWNWPEPTKPKEQVSVLSIFNDWLHKSVSEREGQGTRPAKPSGSGYSFSNTPLPPISPSLCTHLKSETISVSCFLSLTSLYDSKQSCLSICGSQPGVVGFHLHPRGYVPKSEDTFGCHKGGRFLLSSGQRSGMLLNTLQCPRQPPHPPQQRMTQPQMSMMPRFRNLALGMKEVKMDFLT